jgi:hypothetical protein
MDIETDDTNGQNIADNGTDNSGTDNSDVTSDPILSKHLDIAIEAQDGPAKAKDTSEADKKPEAADKTEGDKTSKADSTGDKKDTAAQSKPDKEGKETKGNTSGPQDLVLKGKGPDGTDLVIKGGPERRFYEQLQTSRQRTQFLESEVTKRDGIVKDLQTKFDAMQQSMQTASSLPPAHLATAVRMFTDLQRDPSGTLKKLLAEAVALGHTVEGIGQGIDVEAIKSAIRSELATKETAKEPTAEEIDRQATEEVNQFYNRFSDARPHDALLGAILRDHPDLSLEAAYFQLKDAFAEKGFDWSRSLEDNVAASQARTQEQDKTTDNKPAGNNQKPLPNGSNIEPIEKHNDVVMSENADMGDIVKAAMREQGMNV